MSDDSEKTASAWPQLPASEGKCHMRILIQDGRGLTSEVVIPCADWDTAIALRELVRYLVDERPTDIVTASTQQNQVGDGGKERP